MHHIDILIDPQLQVGIMAGLWFVLEQVFQPFL